VESEVSPPGRRPGPAPDSLLPLVRGGIAVLLALAIANGVFLYFFPSRAEPDYAWAIALPVSAAFLGAGYLAGMVAGGLGVFAARYWRSVRVLVPGFSLLGLTLLVATMIDADTFRWDYPPTWAWTGIYASLPFVVAFLWVLQERDAGAQPERDPRLASIWAPALVLGTILAIVGIALFVAPDPLLERWAWDITPLLARVFGGWYLFAACALLFSAVSVRRAHEVPIAYATVATWCALILLLPLLYSDSVRTDEVGFWLLVGVHSALLAACAFAVLRSTALMRAEGEYL
jgi:hypothetical protein